MYSDLRVPSEFSGEDFLMSEDRLVSPVDTTELLLRELHELVEVVATGLKPAWEAGNRFGVRRLFVSWCVEFLDFKSQEDREGLKVVVAAFFSFFIESCPIDSSAPTGGTRCVVVSCWGDPLFLTVLDDLLEGCCLILTKGKETWELDAVLTRFLLILDTSLSTSLKCKYKIY